MTRPSDVKRRGADGEKAQYASADGALQSCGPEFFLYAKLHSTLTDQYVCWVWDNGNDQLSGVCV